MNKDIFPGYGSGLAKNERAYIDELPGSWWLAQTPPSSSGFPDQQISIAIDSSYHTNE